MPSPSSGKTASRSGAASQVCLLCPTDRCPPAVGHLSFEQRCRRRSACVAVPVCLWCPKAAPLHACRRAYPIPSPPRRRCGGCSQCSALLRPAPPCSALLIRRSTVTPGPPTSGPCPVVHSYCAPRPLSTLRLAQPCEPGAISAGRRFGPQHDAAVQINLDVLSFGLATQVIRTGHRPSTASSLPFLMAATPFPSCIRCCCCAADSPNQRHSPALQT